MRAAAKRVRYVPLADLRDSASRRMRRVKFAHINPGLPIPVGRLGNHSHRPGAAVWVTVISVVHQLLWRAGRGSRAKSRAVLFNRCSYFHRNKKNSRKAANRDPSALVLGSSSILIRGSLPTSRCAVAPRPVLCRPMPRLEPRNTPA